MKVVGKLDVCGIKYALVFFDTGDAVGGDGKLAGYTDNVNNRLVVSTDLAKENVVDTVYHEGNHAIFDKSGISHYLAEKLQLSPSSSEYEAFEETLIRMYTPNQIRFYKSMAKLKTTLK